MTFHYESSNRTEIAKAQGKYIVTKSGVLGLSPKALLITKEEGYNKET